jgi:hypothetical protein
MSASDQSLTTPTAIPTPVSGAGSTDLATESSDPQELRALLDRARERLSFYESFDQIIGENLRRTGEMMAETVALREQAAQAIRERQAVDDALQAERERYRALIEGALDEVRTARPVLESMLTRLQDALDELSTEGTSSATSPDPEGVGSESIAAPYESTGETVMLPVETLPATETVPDEPTPRPEPDVTEASKDVDESAMVEETRPEEDVPASTAEVATPDDRPKTMDVLAHGVPSAEVAISLQNLLRDLEHVSKVEAREFADGELRLQIECTGAFPASSLTEWLTSRNGTLASHNGKTVELTFS